MLELVSIAPNLRKCSDRNFVAFAVVVCFGAYDYATISRDGLVNLTLKLCIEQRGKFIKPEKILGYLMDFVKAGYLDYDEKKARFSYKPQDGGVKLKYNR